MLVAAIFAIAYAFLRVLTDDTIIDAEDVGALPGKFAVIGVIPALPEVRAEMSKEIELASGPR